VVALVVVLSAEVAKRSFELPREVIILQLDDVLFLLVPSFERLGSRSSPDWEAGRSPPSSVCRI
jgi:hypothetical protein